MPRFFFNKSLQHLQQTRTITRANVALSVLNTTMMRWIFIIAIAACGVLYVWLVNSSATAGFYLSDLDKRVAKLDNEYRAAEVQQAQLQSLDHIEKQGQALEMVVASDVRYAREDHNVALGDE